jgi:hypothetical protein
MTARDLTDPHQNNAVLDWADRLAADGSAPVPQEIAPEARALARSRTLLRDGLSDAGPDALHLSVVWAMYGETARMAPRTQNPHGEDFVRTKVAQLDWLTSGTSATWDILACDDGCPDQPSSAEAMEAVIEQEGYPADGHRRVAVMRLADVLGTDRLGPAFSRLTSTSDSRKGGSILAALATAIDRRPAAATHVVCYTDADLSANLGQLGSLAMPVVDGAAAALGQRYGVPGATLVKETGPTQEPQSTGSKPDKLIILFRHMVRALLVPDLAHVLDTQAGFKAFDAARLAPVLPEMTSFNETFDVELLIRMAQRYGSDPIAVQPICFTEDYAQTNFPSVDPGAGHLAMVRQVVELHDRLVAPHAPASGEAADLLAFLRDLDLDGYVRLVEGLRELDVDDPTLFERRWPVRQLRELAAA